MAPSVGASSPTPRLWVRFPVRKHPQVSGLIPRGERMGCTDVSLSLKSKTHPRRVRIYKKEKYSTQFLTEDSSGHRARGPRAGPRPPVSNLRAGPGTPRQGRGWGVPVAPSEGARLRGPLGRGEKKGLKLDPVGQGQRLRPHVLSSVQTPVGLSEVRFQIRWLHIWNVLNGNCRKNEKYFRVGTQYLPSRGAREPASGLMRPLRGVAGRWDRMQRTRLGDCTQPPPPTSATFPSQLLNYKLS